MGYGKSGICIECGDTATGIIPKRRIKGRCNGCQQKYERKLKRNGIHNQQKM